MELNSHSWMNGDPIPSRFAAGLPVTFAADTRVIFTSFASLPRAAA